MKNYLTLILSTLVLTTSSSMAQVRPLKMGDQCPDALSRLIRQAAGVAPRPAKALLINFWGSYCVPCVNELPAMDSLQKIYADELTILCVSERGDRQVPEVLRRVFKNRQARLVFLTNDTLIKRYFPHTSFPNYVWLDTAGVVRAFPENIDGKVIAALLDQSRKMVRMKMPVLPYDLHRPLYASRQAVLQTDSELLYHSMITRYRPDLKSGAARGKNFIVATNNPLVNLFQFAYGKFDLAYLDPNRVIARGLETFEDSVKLGIRPNKAAQALWLRHKPEWSLTYELKVPDGSYSNDQLFELMQQDLNRYAYSWGIHAHLEQLNRKVIALVYTADSHNVSFKDGAEQPAKFSTPNSMRMTGQPMTFFLSQVLPFTQGKVTAPVVNETGYTGKVNLDLELESKDLPGFNKALKKYGLEFVEKEEPVDMIVIEKTGR